MTPEIGDVLVAVPSTARANIQLAHSAIYSMFAENGQRDFVFAYEPDLGSVARVRSRHFKPEVKAMMIPLATPAPGEVVSFRLVASPMTKPKVLCGKRKRYDTDEERLAWLGHKARLGGFEIVGEATIETSQARVSKRGAVYYVDRSVFSGNLRVVDETLFAAALEAGIGAHKTLGFGLLTTH